ncbi:MAG TPA: SRPBCC domain-containing protein [Burkholderiales bacterium]|nr:SRPBCC domain-containing protein [Burkholderiales bacterium]
MSAEQSAGPADRPFVISREFDAPRDLVWKSWTEAQRLKQWWGPKGFIVHTCTVDLRPGGLFHYGMSAPDGSDMWGRFLYREIDRPRRLEFIVSFSDPDGGITRHPGHLQWPLQMLSTVTFQETAGRTTVTVQWEAYEATDLERKTFQDGMASMQQGWTGTFEQFRDYLAKAVMEGRN